MKISSNRFFIRIFLPGIVFLLISLNGCAGLKKGTETAGRVAGEPILVSLDADYMIWCGPDALIYAYAERDVTKYIKTEIYWYDIHTGRKILIGKETQDVYIAPMACTPDGEWFVYLNKGSLRWDESGVNSILDVWRYEVATGRHERITIAYDVSGFEEGILSPDGKKLYLGEKPALEVEMPEPRWEIIWSELEDLSGAVWFRDSSAVITSYWGRRDGNDDIVIEAVSPGRKTVVFSPEELGDFNLFFSDKRGRIYVYFWDSFEKIHVLRCDVNVEERDLSCGDVFMEGNRKIEDFEVFADGEAVAFTENGGSCVKATRIGEEKAHCITPPIDTLGNYRISPGRSIEISPDDRWLAFDLVRQDKTGEGIGEDLYIIELQKD